MWYPDGRYFKGEFKNGNPVTEYSKLFDSDDTFEF